MSGGKRPVISSNVHSLWEYCKDQVSMCEMSKYEVF
jgi:hypothetical protein